MKNPHFGDLFLIKIRYMNTIKPILEGIYNNVEQRRTCIPLFRSSPGLGKTMLVHQFAKEKGVKLVTFIASQRLPNEISGIALPIQGKEEMSFFDFNTLLEMKDGDILFFDEVLNANPMVLNACLNLLEDRRTISGRKLADIMIVAAGNPQGATVMTPQQKERFIFYDVNYNEKAWGNYMYDKYAAIPKEIITQLSVLIKNENFHNSTVNYFTPRSIDKAIGMMINETPTPYKSSLYPILSTTIENTLEDSILPDGYEWKKNEKISWLNLQKHLINDKANSK